MKEEYISFERGSFRKIVTNEPTEEEIHAERSERFIKNGHIVCNPFGDYNEGPDYTDHDDESWPVYYSG